VDDGIHWYQTGAAGCARQPRNVAP
jgi:hypothetical protein